jgi:hypothetical protein
VCFRGDDSIEALIKVFDFVLHLMRVHNQIGKSVWWKREGDQGGFNVPVYDLFVEETLPNVLEEERKKTIAPQWKI